MVENHCSTYMTDLQQYQLVLPPPHGPAIGARRRPYAMVTVSTTDATCLPTPPPLEHHRVSGRRGMRLVASSTSSRHTPYDLCSTDDEDPFRESRPTFKIANLTSNELKVKNPIR